MNKFSNKLTDTRARLLDAEATLHFLNNRENLNNLLDEGCPDVVLGALIGQVDNLVSQACEDCELMEKIHNDDFLAELRQSASEARDYIENGPKGSPPVVAAGAPEPTRHSEHMDTLDEIHEQSLAMLNMLMLNHRHASQGEESLADSVLESYTWQLVNNMERAVKAAAALSEGLKEGVSHE